jgi:Asp/Glu/hydantoin racemase
LLLNLVETHVPGDTAHAETYDYPVLFKVVEEAVGDKVLAGDTSIRPAIIAAAQDLERMGVKAISSNCGFMLHHQDAVRRAVNIPVVLSSLLQLPTLSRMIDPNKKIAILAGAKELITPEFLKLAGLGTETKVVVGSIEHTTEFQNFMTADLDTDAFQARLEESADALFTEHDDIGAILLECAIFTPYAAALQRRYGLPTADFVSLIDYAHYITHRRSPA